MYDSAESAMRDRAMTELQPAITSVKRLILGRFLWLRNFAYVGRALLKATRFVVALVVCAPLIVVAGPPEAPQLILQTGHNAAVTALSFATRDHLLVSGSQTCELKGWSIAAARETHNYIQPALSRTREASSKNIALSYPVAVIQVPGRDLVATAHLNEAILLWTPTEDRPLKRLQAVGRIRLLAANRDGKMLASSDGSTVQLWNLHTFTEIRRFKFMRPLLDLTFLDNQFLEAIDADTRIHKVSLKDGRDELSQSVTFCRTERASLSSDGRYVALTTEASSQMNAILLVFDIVENKSLFRRDWSTPEFTISHDNRWLAYTTSDTLRLLDLVNGSDSTLTETGIFNVTALSFSQDGSMLAAGDALGRITVFTLSTQNAVSFIAKNTAVTSLAVSQSNRWLALGGADSRLRLFDLNAGSPLPPLLEHQFAISTVRFGKDGNWGVSSSAGRETRYWKPSRWSEGTLEFQEQHLDMFETPTFDIVSTVSTAFSDDGNWTAAATRTAGGAGQIVTVRLWNGFFKRSAGEIQSIRNTGTNLIFSPGGRWLAVFGNQDGAVICDVVRQKTFRSFQGAVTSVAFSPDESLIALGFFDGSIVIESFGNSRPRLRLSKHSSAITAMAFGPSKGNLFSTDAGGEIRIWNGQHFGLVAKFSLGQGGTNAIAVNDASGLIWASTFEGSTQIWDIGTLKLVAQLILFSEVEDWAVVTPDGLFDGTPEAMRQLCWRATKNGTDEIFPLDVFFSDFYRPGLLAEISAGQAPRAEVDIAAVIQIPGLRTMLAQKQAHLQNRDGRAVLCFSEVPGVVVAIAPGDTTLPVRINDYEVNPEDESCKYRKELPKTEASANQLIRRLNNWAAESFRTPWDDTQSITKTNVLHVLTIGISKYHSGSGFEMLPYAVMGAKRIETFFNEQEARAQKPYAHVRVWEGLYDAAARKDDIRKALAEVSRKVSANDVVLIYLAGHGVVSQDQEMFYFAAFDAQEENIVETGLNTAMLADDLRKIPAKRIVLMIDACQSGGAVEALTKIGEAKARVEIMHSKSNIGRENLGVGVHIIAATLPLAYAVEFGSGQSALVSTFLGSLRQNAGAISIRQITRFLMEMMPGASKQAVGFRQVPFIKSIGLDFALVEN